MTTNKYIVRLKAQLDQAIVQRDHWKQLAHKRNYIEVSETDPESRTESVWRVDADTVRRMWAQIGHMEAALAEGDAPQPGPDVRGLVEAASRVLDGLNARIDEASMNEDPIPIFDGIADLHDALSPFLEVDSHDT